MHKTVTLVMGCPGDGKTSLSKKLPGKAIAADDYPNLYIDGVYQADLQKTSHEWCHNTVEEWMKAGEEEIIVHNTFTRNIYRKPYIELAAKYGYAVHVVTSEAVILANGERTTSTHNVPDAVLESMRSGWEPFNPVQKLGITAKDIAVQMRGLDYPNVIVFDMYKTIKCPKEGRTFPRSPDDFEIVPEFEEWAKKYDKRSSLLYVVSNQRGIGTGQKTIDFLEEEIRLLAAYLDEEFDIGFVWQFATNQGGNNSIYYNLLSNIFVHETCTGRTDKPGIEAFLNITKDAGKSFRNYWIVGDAHTDNASEDWQFAQACQKANPEIDIRYVPIELLNVYWELI
ncbi:AAA family ATPase [Nostoc linckia]|uniref:AAA family ATPase n=1 Tax=Nostoc linckia TaxID=92942 RepID=UPI000BFFE159|nr:AAA family ATPase [Nostoc linckia]